MPIDYGPNGNSSNVGHGWSGYTWTDPGDVEFTTSKTERLDAKYFASPMTDNILGLWQAAVAGHQYRQLFTCASDLVVGDPVYLSSALTVTLADATTEASARVLGYCIWKPSTTSCYVVRYYNKNMLSGLTVNQPVYLDDAGSFSASPGTVTKVVGVATGVTTALLFANEFQGSSGYSGISSYSGSSGRSGYSGWSSYSGPSGQSGQSGFSGVTLDSGYSGRSGWSGLSGWSGTYSGASGISGVSGGSGTSGRSGWSGASGFSGCSAWSGVSGMEGPQGQSAFSGFSGTSGHSGVSGFFGRSGTSGWSGMNGIVAYSGTSGWSGAGKSGWSGTSGRSGWSGNSGRSGWSGYSAVSGHSGTSAISGNSGFSGGAGQEDLVPNLIDNGNFMIAQRMNLHIKGLMDYSSYPSSSSSFSGFSSVTHATGGPSICPPQDMCVFDRWRCLGFSSYSHPISARFIVAGGSNAGFFDTPIVSGGRKAKIDGYNVAGIVPCMVMQVIDSDRSTTCRNKPLVLSFFANTDTFYSLGDVTVHAAVLWNRNRLKSAIVNDWSSTDYTTGNFFSSDDGVRIVRHESWSNPNGKLTMSMNAAEVGYEYDGLTHLCVMIWSTSASYGHTGTAMELADVDLHVGSASRDFKAGNPGSEWQSARSQLQFYGPRTDQFGSAWSGVSGYGIVGTGNWNATSGMAFAGVKFDSRMISPPSFSAGLQDNDTGTQPRWYQTAYTDPTMVMYDGTSEWSCWSAAAVATTPDGAVISGLTNNAGAFRPGIMSCKSIRWNPGLSVPHAGFVEFSAEL